MTREEFNNKYKDYIEPGFEDQGLEFNIPEITRFLDGMFEDLIKIPEFTYSQIKIKFGTCRFYTSLGSTLTSLVEYHIDSILDKILDKKQ